MHTSLPYSVKLLPKFNTYQSNFRFIKSTKGLRIQQFRVYGPAGLQLRAMAQLGKQ